MRASPKIERDDFDRWIGWALKTATQNAHPSEKVWQRIVHRIASSDETGQVANQVVARQGKSLNELLFLPSYVGIEQYNPFVYAGLTLSIGV
jgi:hypothetical protein